MKIIRKIATVIVLIFNLAIWISMIGALLFMLYMIAYGVASRWHELRNIVMYAVITLGLMVIYKCAEYLAKDP